MHRLSIHLIPYTYYPLTSLILSAQYIWFDLLSLQTKNYEMLFAASPLYIQQEGVRAKF